MGSARGERPAAVGGQRIAGCVLDRGSGAATSNHHGVAGQRGQRGCGVERGPAAGGVVGHHRRDQQAGGPAQLEAGCRDAGRLHGLIERGGDVRGA